MLKRMIRVWGRRAAFAFAGVAVCLVLLEASLALIGRLYLLGRERAVRRSLEHGAGMRVACLGESMTYGRYPPALERLFNARYPGGGVAVIDKGMYSSHSDYVVSILDETLRLYRPAVVIVMMGCNDAEDALLFQGAPARAAPPAVYRLRTYRLIRFLFNDWLRHGPSVRPGFPTAQEERRALAPGDARAASGKRPWQKLWLEKLKLYGRLRETVNPEKETAGAGNAEGESLEQTRQRLIGLVETQRATCQDYRRLADIERQEGRPDRAESLYREAWTRFPDAFSKYEDFVPLIRLYEDGHKPGEAAALLEQVVCIDPSAFLAYDNLVYNLVAQHGEDTCQEALEICRQLADRFPAMAGVYRLMALTYVGLKNDVEAERCYQIALARSAGDIRMNTDLLDFYRERGRWNDMETVLQTLLDRGCPERERIYSALSELARRQGNGEKAAQYRRLAADYARGHIHPVTQRNWRAVAARVLGEGTLLVAMQYPMRPLEPLRDMLGPYAGRVVLVDNDASFRHAVERDGYEAYFEDSFGGDFGHTTPKGSEMMARNIMETLASDPRGARLLEWLDRGGVGKAASASR